MLRASPQPRTACHCLTVRFTRTRRTDHPVNTFGVGYSIGTRTPMSKGPFSPANRKTGRILLLVLRSFDNYACSVHEDDAHHGYLSAFCPRISARTWAIN